MGDVIHNKWYLFTHLHVRYFKWMFIGMGTNQLNFGKKQSRVQNHLMPFSMSWVFNIKCLLSSFTEWVILTTSLLTLWLFLIWACMRQIKITSSMKFSKKATVVCLLFVFSNLFAVWITSFLSLNLLVIFLICLQFGFGLIFSWVWLWFSILLVF